MTQFKQLKKEELALIAGRVFNPNTPVSAKDLFSGRTGQIRRVLDVVFQRGQHLIIFGERGVGKTSLANVLSSFAGPQSNILATRINCDRGDTFTSVWIKLFDEMNLTGTRGTAGFNQKGKTVSINSKDFFEGLKIVTPNDVRKALVQLGESFLPILIIDEFDRLNEETRKLFADLIKGLSDYSLSSTIVLIGVGDTVEDIIHEHQSVSRALVQVQMPRMTPDEINDIINNSLTKLGMTITKDALKQISLLSKGLPHYAHLIGLNATRDSLDSESLQVDVQNVDSAVKKAVEDAQHSIKTTYHGAIRSAKKKNLFVEVLLSCALATTNELGEFAAQDLREPMLKITGKNYAIPAYAQHLNEFSELKRGNILIKSGGKRLTRYKFSEPLMQPFIIMQGILDDKISFRSLLLS